MHGAISLHGQSVHAAELARLRDTPPIARLAYQGG